MILALDTATSRVVVAVGDARGRPRAMAGWTAGYRHGERLVGSIEDVLREGRVARADLAAIAVGTGPGAFTGLRVGIATAKALAHGLGLPIVGIPTGAALLAAAAAELDIPTERLVLLLPAGPADRVEVRAGRAAALLPGGSDPELGPGDVLVAVDLHGRAPGDAVDAGERARERLAPELLRLAAGRIRRDDADDLAGLVPEYVTLPRGVREVVGEVRWSRDPR